MPSGREKSIRRHGMLPFRTLGPARSWCHVQPGRLFFFIFLKNVNATHTLAEGMMNRI